MEHKIVLYSTHCPLCKGLEKALQNKNIPYEMCTDIETMKNLGITRAPMLLVDDILMNGKDGLRWVLSQE
jgi:glutaredoxin-related protein